MRVALLLLFAGLAHATEATLAVIPDSQDVTGGAGTPFSNLMTWVAANESALSIKAVASVGDISPNAGFGDGAYVNAKAAYDLLSVPLLTTPGNHDYGFTGGGTADLRERLTNGNYSGGYDGFFGPSSSLYSGKGWYIGGWGGGTAVGYPLAAAPAGAAGASNANMAIRVNIGGLRFLIIGMEFFPRADALAWADSVYATYPDYYVAVVTHAYMNGAGTLCTDSAPTYSPNGYELDAATQTGNTNCGGLWDWVKTRSRIRLVVSGHWYGTDSLTDTTLVHYRQDNNDAGHPVLQMKTDFQGVHALDTAYDAVVSLMTFKDSGTCGGVSAPCVSISHYSANDSAYYDGTGGRADLRGNYSFPMDIGAPAGLTIQPTRTTGADLVTNGGIETASPLNWTTTYGLSRKTDEFHAGTASIGVTDPYLISFTQTTTQDVTLTAGVYSLSGWIKVSGLAATVDTDAYAIICLSGIPGGYGNCIPTGIRGTADWTQYRVDTIVVGTGGTYQVTLGLHGDPDGSVWFDDVELHRKALPLEPFLLYPNYRGLLYSDKSQTVRFSLAVDPPEGTASDYTISGAVVDETTFATVLSDSFAGTATEATFNFTGLPSDHTYLVGFKLIRISDSAVIYTYPNYRIAPAAAVSRGTVFFDENNRILLDGTPTFVLGVYDSLLGYAVTEEDWEASLDKYRRLWQLPINIYLHLQYGAAANNAIVSLMDALENHGVKYLQIDNCFSDNTVEENGTFFWEVGSLADIAARVAHVQFLGTYAADECEPQLAADTFLHYRRTQHLDQNGLALGVLFGNPSLVLWKDAVDLMATDPYPFGYAPPYLVDTVSAWTLQAKAAVQNSRPIITVLQLGGVAHYPTLADYRNMSYMAIAEGANGLMFWALHAGSYLYTCDGSDADHSPEGANEWCPAKVAKFNNLKSIMTELRALPLAELDQNALLTDNSNSNVHTRVKRVGGTTYVIASNISDGAQSATFTLSSAPAAVSVYSESRSIAPSGTSFTDSFEAYEAHVYQAMDTVAARHIVKMTGAGKLQ